MLLSRIHYSVRAVLYDSFPAPASIYVSLPLSVSLKHTHKQGQHCNDSKIPVSEFMTL